MRRLLLPILFLLAVDCAFAERPPPEKQIQTFFAILDHEGPDTAIQFLAKDQALQKLKGSDTEAPLPELEATLRTYGSIKRVVQVDQRTIGGTFERIRIVTYNSSGAPMYWKILFVRGSDGWQVYSFAFNGEFQISIDGGRQCAAAG